jgi:hypothetical protein
VVLARLPARSGFSHTADNLAGGADSAAGLGSPLALRRVKRSNSLHH